MGGSPGAGGLAEQGAAARSQSLLGAAALKGTFIPISTRGPWFALPASAYFWKSPFPNGPSLRAPILWGAIHSRFPSARPSVLRESVRDAGAFGDPGFQVPPTAPAGPQKARNKHVFVAEVIISGALVGLEATKAPGAERSGSFFRRDFRRRTAFTPGRRRRSQRPATGAAGARGGQSGTSLGGREERRRRVTETETKRGRRR